jgi:hypothetical protein
VEVADEGQIIVLQPGKHSVGSRAVVLDKPWCRAYATRID